MNYFVGDIHGCFTRLQKQLDTFFDPEVDHLYSVGDLVDRGPDNELVVEYLNKPWFHAVLGNHEDMIIQGYTSPELQYLSCINGGEWFFNLDKSSQKEIVDLFLDKLPLTRTIYSGGLNVGIVHAEPPDDWVGPIYKEQAIWGRDRYNYGDTTPVKNIDRVYVGHTPVHDSDVEVLGNVYFIDNGAWYVNSTILKAHTDQGISTDHLYRDFVFHTVHGKDNKSRKAELVK